MIRNDGKSIKTEGKFYKLWREKLISFCRIILGEIFCTYVMYLKASTDVKISNLLEKNEEHETLDHKKENK